MLVRGAQGVKVGQVLDRRREADDGDLGAAERAADTAGDAIGVGVAGAVDQRDAVEADLRAFALLDLDEGTDCVDALERQ